MDYAIETSDLTKCFGSLTAVNKLNLKVQKNTVHGFLGPKGAEKPPPLKSWLDFLHPILVQLKFWGERSM